MSNASVPFEDNSPGLAPHYQEMGDNEGPSDDRLEENRTSILREKVELDAVLEGLDTKLNRVLKKQEHDYLRGYSIYVKQKEEELRALIQKLNDKNSNNSLKDDLIYKLKQTIMDLHDQQITTEREKGELAEKIKFWSARAEAFEQDKNFLQN